MPSYNPSTEGQKQDQLWITLTGFLESGVSGWATDHISENKVESDWRRPNLGLQMHAQAFL